MKSNLKKKRATILVTDALDRWIRKHDPMSEGSLARSLAVIFKKAGFKRDKDEPRRAK